MSPDPVTADRGAGTADGSAPVRPRLRRAAGVLLLGFMAAVVLLTYAAIGWTLRRGFDWTDESFVYTLIASNRRTVGEAWGFQHLLHPLYALTGQSVLVFRVLRLAGYVLLGAGLVWAARLVLRLLEVSLPRAGWVFILLLAQVGTFLAWSYPPRYVGYNELASWFTQTGVALILISLAWGVSPPDETAPQQGSPPPGESSLRERTPRWVLWAVWAGLGALATVLVFAKMTSAVAFGVILALAIVVPNHYLTLWKRVVSVLSGIAVLLALLWVAGAPISFYLQNAYSLAFDKSVRDAFGHPTAGLLTIYASSMTSTARGVFLAVLLFTLAMAAFGRKSRSAEDRHAAGEVASAGGAASAGDADDAGDAGEKRTVGWVLDGITWVLGALLILTLFALSRRAFWVYLGEVVVFVGAAGLLGLAILAANRSTMRAATPSRAFAVVVAVVAVAATPLIGSLGTNNRLAGQFLWSATLWVVVLGVALVLLSRRASSLRSRARAVPVLIGCAVLALSAMGVRAGIAKPYRSGPLMSLGTATSVPALRGIQVSRADATYIDWVAAAGVSLGAEHVPAVVINGFKPQKTRNSLGALYAFNQSGYANPWLGRDWPAAFNSLRLACTKDRPADLFVLQPGFSGPTAASTVGVTKSLAACGIDFPGDFRVVARHPSPDPGLSMTIWRLR